MDEDFEAAANALEKAAAALRRMVLTPPIGVETATVRMALVAAGKAAVEVERLVRADAETAHNDPADLFFELALSEKPSSGYRLVADRAYQLARLEGASVEILTKLTHERARRFMKARAGGTPR